jgi:hypothetical protein
MALCRRPFSVADPSLSPTSPPSPAFLCRQTVIVVTRPIPTHGTRDRIGRRAAPRRFFVRVPQRALGTPWRTLPFSRYGLEYFKKERKIESQIMTSIETTAFQRLESEDRLVKPAHKGPTHTAGRFGFRGEIALAHEPELNLTAVFAAAEDGDTALSFLAGQLASFKELPALVEVLGDTIKPDGKYFIYVADVKRGDRYQVGFGDKSLYVLPYDDVSVYNELIDFLYLDKTKMKKFDTAAKIDAIADGAAVYDQTFPKVTYEEGVAKI